jgi:[acyl-carrier-protein] S-malonyltransferase
MSAARPKTAGPSAAAPRIAVVFPGQGSQRPGMALPWSGHVAAARWTEADEVLGRDVSRLGTRADADELREPASCQVALFVHHAVLFDAWQSTAEAPPLVLAGHSLGEYDALYAAGVLSFADALRLVDARARATQSAAASAPGGMAACLGCDPDEVKAACRRAGAHLANDNAPGQMVVAGRAAALDELTAALAGGRGRVTRLEVGAAYHSPHMQAAVAPLAAALDAADFRDGTVPVIANVDATLHGPGTDWPELLRRQLTSPVRWRETMDAVMAAGATTIVELGASPVLTGLAKRTAPGLIRQFVAEPAHVAVAA